MGYNREDTRYKKFKNEKRYAIDFDIIRAMARITSFKKKKYLVELVKEKLTV